MGFFDWVSRMFSERPSSGKRDQKKAEENLNLDGELFVKICKILYSESPEGSGVLVMEANLPFGDDASSPYREMSCHVRHSDDEITEFTPSEEAAQSLFELVYELREAMNRQNHPVWRGFKIIVDVPQNKYNADFIY